MTAGHSLGGALANVCAFDIAAAVKEAGATGERGEAITVSCSTIGAPRTGNTAFCSKYNALVPESWAVINDQVSACQACYVLAHNIHAVAQEWATPSGCFHLGQHIVLLDTS